MIGVSSSKEFSQILDGKKQEGLVIQVDSVVGIFFVMSFQSIFVQVKGINKFRKFKFFEGQQVIKVFGSLDDSEDSSNSFLGSEEDVEGFQVVKLVYMLVGFIFFRMEILVEEIVVEFSEDDVVVLFQFFFLGYVIFGLILVNFQVLKVIFKLYFSFLVFFILVVKDDLDGKQEVKF